MSTDPRFGGLYSISTSQGALADSAPIRQHRRSIATIKALQESASEGSLYPSVAVKPELAQDWQDNVSQQDGFHSAAFLREPIGMLTPYVENELTRSIKNMGRQHGMNGRRAYPSEAPPSADGDAPTKVLMRTQLLPSTVARDLWRTSKKPLSPEIVKARAAAEAKAKGAAEAKVAGMPTESERCAAGIRAVMEVKTRMGMSYDEYLSENPSLSRSVTTDDYFSRGMEWTGAPRYHSLASPCTLLHPVHPLTSTRKYHHHLILHRYSRARPDAPREPAAAGGDARAGPAGQPAAPRRVRGGGLRPRICAAGGGTPSLAVPKLSSCTSGRVWRLWAAQHFQGQRC